jgi:hypothetical protein
VRLQQPVDRRLGDEVVLLVGEAHRQLPRRRLRKLQRQVDLATDIIRDAIQTRSGRERWSASASGPPSRYRSYQR